MNLLERVIHFDLKVKKRFSIVFLCVFFSSCHDAEKVFPTDEAVCFKLVNNNYLSAKKNNQNRLEGIGKNAFSWEKFFLEKSDGLNHYYIRANSGLYLAYNNSNKVVFGNEKEKRNAGVFELVSNKEYYQLKTREGNVFNLGSQKEIRATGTGKPLVFSVVNEVRGRSWDSFNGIFFGRFLIQLLGLLGVMFLYFKYLRKNVKNLFSYKALIIIGFVGLFSIANIQKWNYEKVIANDSIIYYEYLPAAFIFNDMSFSFLQDPPADFKGDVWVRHNEKTGRKAIKFTMGMSIMYLPFFAVGHIGAKLFDYTSYGYSYPYMVMFCFCGWFYAFIGLYYLRKILLLYFNDVVTSFTLISIGLGTNLFYYITIDPTMTHPASFCLIAMFIWFTIKWYNQKNLKMAFLLGALIGVIALIRPTNALIALVFIFFKITTIQQVKERFILFWKHKAQILMIVFLAILTWLPQFIFWKYSTGDWLYFSYEDEGFFFANPQIFNGLFSYRKGWFVYTPIMVFSIIGLFFTYRNNKKWFASLCVFIPLNIFIVYSWWCWWYGGSFGSRPMIDSYALMAISLASFYHYFE